LPEWIGALGGACWVCDPNGRVVHSNAEAARLIARGALPGQEPECHAALGGLDESGRTRCRPECDPMRKALAGEPLEPFLMRLGGRPEGGRWYLVRVIPLTGPDGSRPWLVHCASDVDRFHRMEEYLRDVAQRSRPVRAGPPPRRSLTPREAEILALLVHDEDPQRIAAHLFLSYSTVRNHIGHILSKLGLHSVQEAVAWQLLQGGAAREAGANGE
jgi:DNA-binding CsgD family transcriptional regulator